MMNIQPVGVVSSLIGRQVKALTPLQKLAQETPLQKLVQKKEV